MNKIITGLIVFIVVLFAIFFGVSFFQDQSKTENLVTNTTQLSEEIVDDCTEEMEELQKENELDTQASTQSQITLSPNCSFIFKTRYEKCGHIVNKYMNIPTELVNKTQEEIQDIYSEWIIEEFKNNEEIKTKSEEGSCEEHYVLRNVDGEIVVYLINDDGSEEVYEYTEIAIDYLTETDKISIKNGLKVYGKEHLNQTLEDFE